MIYAIVTISDFNSRSPCGERLGDFTMTTKDTTFQLTLPVWGATALPCDSVATRLISTHAPRVGSDKVRIAHNHRRAYFNSRSPCGERQAPPSRAHRKQYFNSRSPCGERPELKVIVPDVAKFQLTLPVWGATLFGIIVIHRGRISTHAPRVGSDEDIMAIQIFEKISTHAPRVGSDQLSRPPS